MLNKKVKSDLINQLHHGIFYTKLKALTRFHELEPMTNILLFALHEFRSQIYKIYAVLQCVILHYHVPKTRIK